ncbi:hypothetical protein GTW51_19010 [Aurantimonas aggregata]|uniref:Phage tail protein n=1 Tax=Aurantimonas aggregata TaxID=2047720 RepID=A0A6L9MLR2_9HYPH|nr:hypothetical protein [Aurantimonas aggregata]NDV88789.1 hypothetical protein [Aurantimonas aggregata]
MSLMLTVRGNGLPRLEDAVEALGEKKARNAYRRAINEAGRDTKTPTQRALAEQTGLKVGVARKALRVKKASASDLQYELQGKGGFIRLKYFGARETRRGVSAAPFGQRQVLAHTFIKGGLFPGRKELGLGGQVFRPTRGTRWGRDFETMKSDVRIPDEMVKGATADAFQRIGQAKLSEKVARHIRLVTKGVLT